MCWRINWKIKRMKKCKICKEKFTPIRSSLEPTCDNYDCKVSYALIVVEKQKISKDKKAKDDWSKEKKILRDNTKKLSEYEAEAKKSFQKFIRFRDSGKECISCFQHKDGYDGGHFKKAEIYSGVIFHEMNCHAQCRKCNRFLNGNELNYRKGLIMRYGEEYANFIEDLANSTRVKKYTKQELIDIKKKYDLLIKQSNL